MWNTLRILYSPGSLLLRLGLGQGGNIFGWSECFKLDFTLGQCPARLLQVFL